MAVAIKSRRDSAADWTANDPTLALGEIGYETDTTKFKVGDGATAWTSLGYATGNALSVKLDDLTAPDANTDLDASTTKHGLVVKATAPAANVLNVVAIANGETVYTNKGLFDATVPSALGTASAGTGVVAARVNHVHAMPTAFDISPAAIADHAYTGFYITATCGAAITRGQVCYQGSDGKMELAKADSANTMPAEYLMVSNDTAEDATANFLVEGYYRDDSLFNLTSIGQEVYVSDSTAGAVLQGTGTFGSTDQVQMVGTAYSADIIHWRPNSTIVVPPA